MVGSSTEVQNEAIRKALVKIRSNYNALYTKWEEVSLAHSRVRCVWFFFSSVFSLPADGPKDSGPTGAYVQTAKARQRNHQQGISVGRVAAGPVAGAVQDAREEPVLWNFRGPDRSGAGFQQGQSIACC